MIETLQILLLAVHLLVVQIGSAGPLLCVWLHWRYARREDAVAGRVGLRLAKWSPVLIAVGALTGAVLVGLLWRSDGAYVEALRRIVPSKYWFALAELAFFYICMVPYVLLWEAGRRRPLVHALLAVLSATNLLYHFPPLMAVIATLAARSELRAAPVDAATFRHLLLDSEVAARTLHAWLASFAAAGVAVMWLGSRENSNKQDDPRAVSIIKYAARLALAAVLLQLLSGVWVLVTLPAGPRSAIYGGSGWATALMLLALAATFALLHHLSAAALGDVSRRTVMRSALLLVVTVLLMSSVSRLMY